MQFQADILGAEVARPTVHETTALGAAMLAGLTLGVWKNREELRLLLQEERAYFPLMTEEERVSPLEPTIHQVCLQG